MFFPISTFPSALCSSRSNSVVYTSFSLWGTLAGDLRQKVRRVRSGHLYPNPLQEACHWLAESVRADHSSVRWPPTYRSAVSLSALPWPSEVPVTHLCFHFLRRSSLMLPGWDPALSEVSLSPVHTVILFFIETPLKLSNVLCLLSCGYFTQYTNLSRINSKNIKSP